MAERQDSSSIEDYLRVLFELAGEEGTVHSVALARALAVSKPSVHRAVGLLVERGYVTAEPYGPIVLTEEGKERGRALERRYRTIFEFLVNELGVDEKTAAEEAHGIEHALSDGTVRRWMERFGSTE